jgi:hypothetical protein
MELEADLAGDDIEHVDEVRRRAAVVYDEHVGLRGALAQGDEAAQEDVEFLRGTHVDGHNRETGIGVRHVSMFGNGLDVLEPEVRCALKFEAAAPIF